MTRTLAIGGADLFLIRDASLQIAGESALFPSKPGDWGAELAPDGEGMLPVAVTCLLIRCGEETALVDTGFGDVEDPDRAESLSRGLRELSVAPESIRWVIITHAHGDHCLGCTRERDGERAAAFPNARYVLQEKECRSARADEQLWRTQFAVLDRNGRIHRIQGDTRLTRCITCLSTPGHTVGHQSVLIESNGESAVFLGDLSIFATGMEHPEWGPDWAWSREEDIRSRRRIAEYAAGNRSVLIVGHDPQRPFVTVTAGPAGLRVASVP